MHIFFLLATALFTCFSSLQAATPSVVTYDNPQEVGKAAAQKIADTIIAKQQEGKTPIVIGFATGNTPIPTYAAFKKLAREYNLDLSNVITFNLDEYVGLATSHPQSYHSFMFTYLFNDLLESPEYPQGLKIENIHIPKGASKNKEDLSSEELAALSANFPDSDKRETLELNEQLWIAQARAIEYEALIDKLGPIDLQILGVGKNGHIGFAEPGTPFDSPTMVATLTENTRNTNASFFDGNIDEVPQYAITMGISTILKSRAILLLATGATKAEIIDKALKTSITTDIPCTSLWMHDKTSFILDQEAARLIIEGAKGLTVQYEKLTSNGFYQHIVGNTVVGSTRQSNSLYMLYFAQDGSSELCKQGQIFKGFWWIDKDDVVHAYWPDYQSSNPKSLFSPENPSYGKPTSVSYYRSATHPNALMITTKSMQTAATVVPGRQLNGK